MSEPRGAERALEPFEAVATAPAQATTPPTLEVATQRLESWEGDALVVNLFEGVKSPGGATGAADAALGGAVSELIAAGELTGRLGQVAVVHSRGALPAGRVLVVGLGPSGSFGPEAARRAAAAAAKRAQELGVRSLATIAHGAGVGGLDPVRAARATLEGAALAAYDFRGWKRRDESRPRLERVTLLEADAAKTSALEEGARQARAVVAGTYLARDLVNTPANVATPAFLANAAAALEGRGGLRVAVHDAAWAAQHRMGAFLAVARGSANEPRFVVMEHNADRDDLPAVVLVGKGVTFDTGGFSLKTRDGMVPMKADMAGAAAVIGAMATVAELGLELRVVGLCPCVENMADGRAYRPSDVIVAGDGTSIEVLSTDAEGRLALADALVHAKRYAPAAVVDIATLTGASMVALGAGVSSSLFANDDGLAGELARAAEETGERVWRMPLFEEYAKAIEGQVADLKNSGGQRGGVGTSAAFLQAFVDYPWAHLDMAGMELVEKPGARAYLQPGASGYGVRLLVEFLTARAASA
ncbi:MAG TPA: leucyl aminopeptidase [Trueperaceae bacterium]|nr:leucyl aminopeptidase [Trueperaceae bacterium]